MKKIYFIDYDLRKERDYAKLYEALNNLNAKQILESCWCLSYSGTTAELVRDYFRQFIDPNDGLMVSEVTDWASCGVNHTPNEL